MTDDIEAGGGEPLLLTAALLNFAVNLAAPAMILPSSIRPGLSPQELSLVALRGPLLDASLLLSFLAIVSAGLRWTRTTVALLVVSLSCLGASALVCQLYGREGGGVNLVATAAGIVLAFVVLHFRSRSADGEAGWQTSLGRLRRLRWQSFVGAGLGCVGTLFLGGVLGVALAALLGRNAPVASAILHGVLAFAAALILHPLMSRVGRA